MPQHRARRNTPVPSDPRKFGRIEEDGTVIAITPSGERVIGSWQAGTPEEGLAHYAKRFDDVDTEVALLESRLRAHPDDARAIAQGAVVLRDHLAEAAVIGDIANLNERLAHLIDVSGEAEHEQKEKRQAQRATAIARKEELITEAEDLAKNSTEWKQAGDRLRAILDEWRTLRGIEKPVDDELWKRFSRARDEFNRRRGSHFADLDRQRAQARRVKERLIEEARALQDSTDWGPTAGAFKELMARWRAAGRAGREVDNRLWEQFKAAQDTFFQARHGVFAANDEARADNARAKDALLAQYEPQIKPEMNFEQARTLLHELQEKWEEIGHVPRDKAREYDERIQAIENRVADCERDEWRRSDPEVIARAQQFIDRAEQFERDAEAAEKAGKHARAEQARAQAAQWREWAAAASKAVNSL